MAPGSTAPTPWTMRTTSRVWAPRAGVAWTMVTGGGIMMDHGDDTHGPNPVYNSIGFKAQVQKAIIQIMCISFQFPDTSMLKNGEHCCIALQLRELRLLRELVHSRALHWLSLEQRQRQDLERTPGAFEKTPGSCGKFNQPQTAGLLQPTCRYKLSWNFCSGLGKIEIWLI